MFLSFVGITMFAGCMMSPGEIEEGLPKLRDKLPITTKVYLARPLNRNGAWLYERSEYTVMDAFRTAMTNRGIVVTSPPVPKKVQKRPMTREKLFEMAKKKKQDVVLFVQITKWEYGDAGFSGFGGRDEVTMSVMWIDPNKERVITRSGIKVVNSIGKSPFGGGSAEETVSPIIQKYIDKIFDIPEDKK